MSPGTPARTAAPGVERPRAYARCTLAPADGEHVCELVVRDVAVRRLVVQPVQRLAEPLSRPSPRLISGSNRSHRIGPRRRPRSASHSSRRVKPKPQVIVERPRAMSGHAEMRTYYLTSELVQIQFKT